MDKKKSRIDHDHRRAARPDDREERALLPEPPSYYSHKAKLCAINSHDHDMDFGPGVVGYGSTPPVVRIDGGSVTQQAPDDNNPTQRYQQVVFSRFGCILFFLGCCTLLNFVSTSLNSLMIALNCNGLIDFWGLQIISLSTKGPLLFATFVPVLSCCCCLGVRSPRGNFCARVTFYIFTAIIGLVLFVLMLGEAVLYVCAIQAYNATVLTPSHLYCDSGTAVGYVYAIIYINFVTVILSLMMLVAAMYACIKDPQRRCSNQFIQVCVYSVFLLISGTVAIITITIPVLIILSSISRLSVPKLLESYSLTVIGCSGVHLLLVFLFVCFIGPLFCVLENRESPFFSTIFKYTMTFSWLISLILIASGVLSIIISFYLSHIELRKVLTTAQLRPSVIVAMFVCGAVINIIVAIIVTIIWFLYTCGSCLHSIVLCCCLICNL